MIAKYQLDYKKKEVWRRERQNLEETRGLHFWQGPEGLFKQGPNGYFEMELERERVYERVICSSFFEGIVNCSMLYNEL